MYATHTHIPKVADDDDDGPGWVPRRVATIVAIWLGASDGVGEGDRTGSTVAGPRSGLPVPGLGY